MSMFANATNEGLEETTDSLGMGGTVPTGLYDATVKLAYAGAAKDSKSKSLNVHLEIEGRSYEIRETYWVIGKEGNNWSPDKKDPKKKNPLMGFTSADNLCLLTTGYGLAEQESEEKVVNLYNFEQRKEVPTSVHCLTALHGQKVKVGIVEQIVDKQAKQADGTYKNTGETRVENTVDKYFHYETGLTVAEAKQGLEEGIFIEAWKEKNEGKPARNRSKGGSGAKSGAPGGAANTAPKKSLFNK